MADPHPVNIIDEADPEAMRLGAEALRAGEPIIVPTDTVYGLAVIAADAAALDRIFVLKDRPEDKTVAVLVADAAQAEEIAVFGAAERKLAQRYWPGPLTIVAPAVPGSGVSPSVYGTIGVRVPDREFVRALAAELGPLATTSANRSGSPTPLSASAAMGSLTGPTAVVVDGGECPGTPSSVVRCLNGRLLVFREGELSPGELAATADLEITSDS